jgi:REP element-mobilizing transposase RayT
MPRSTLGDGFFHVISRGIRETPVFASDDDRRRFLSLLARTEDRHGWICHAYCLMTTHYHLVLEAATTRLSRGMCELNGRYAREFNRRHRRFGHLFAERFTVRKIESEPYLYDACAYIVLNPVKARLCSRVEQWPWSYSRFGLA